MATEGPVLVLAGAGSGKTTVLVNRIAYMISEKHIRPWNILAITFTNKAAREMKDRIERLLGDTAKDMWIGTFHSVCVRILRSCIDLLGYSRDFVIYFCDYAHAVIAFVNIFKSCRIHQVIFCVTYYRQN